MKAPLLIGADLRKIRSGSLALLKTPGVLEINQDPMGVAGDLIVTHGSQQARLTPPANAELLASTCLLSSSQLALHVS
jgi:alpha-galactosidase